MSPRSRPEVALLAAVVAAAVLVRIAWYAGDIPRFWFAETTSLWIGKALEQGDLWGQWRHLLGVTQVVHVHESAIMMPVALAFQVLLGPSLHLPTLIGAFWGVLAVLLAWRLGRDVHSPAFGLVFAALVAASPLQITWSRLGSVPIGAAAHVLLVCWIGHLAGTRRSVLLGVLAGAAAWASVYQHSSARVALPLVFLAAFAGLRRSRPGLLRAAAVLGVCAMTLVVLLVAVRYAAASWSDLWPQYTGYVGNRGVQTPSEVAADAIAALRGQLAKTVRVYFWSERMHDLFYGTTPREPGTALTARIDAGGLCLLPVAILGLVGLARATWHWRRDFLWLALAVLGLLLPCLSTPTARRFLIFDLAWCAFAAEALVGLLGVRPPAVGVATALGFGAYAFAIVIALGAALPPHHLAVIPFGESGFGDGRTCLACVRNARRWQDAIHAGSFVILFDSDVDREGRTIPGGLPLYGKIAALAAGRPRRFAEFYPIASNFDFDPPRPGQIYDPSQDFISYLASEIEREAPADIRWAFPQPTQWERWLATRLSALGGAERSLDDPALVTMRLPKPDPGLEVTTPWARRAEALALVRDVMGPLPGWDDCAALDLLARERYPIPVLALAPRPAGAEPRWTVGSYEAVHDGAKELTVGEAVALAFETDATGVQCLEILTRHGSRVRFDRDGADFQGAPFKAPLGLGCAALVSGEWWLVDPVAGSVERTIPARWTPPPGRWIGITADAAGHLVLAAADQTLHVFDAQTESEVLRFPARVPPSRRIHFGECTPLVAGDGWLATLDHFQRRLTAYDPHGKPLGTVSLHAALPPMLAHQPGVVAGTRHEIGIGTGYEGNVLTLGLAFDPRCAAALAAPNGDDVPFGAR